MKTTLEKPVVNFGKDRLQVLAPIRGWIARLCAGAEFKRAAGFPFKETRHQLVLVHDRSEDRRSRILRGLVIREADLRNIATYEETPPQAGENFELFKKVAKEFKEKPEAFLHIQIVAA